MAFYHRKFIKNFAKIVAPLTNLLKKSAVTYEWEGACDEAFETLKGILVKAPMLKLPDFDKDFEIHSDAFNFAIGGVLVQEGRPVAFESKKLSKTKRRWLTHVKEMWAVIRYLKTWGHYIGSKDVVVWINNVTLKYFATQCKLSSKQVRWQDTLALFNVDIQHKPRKENVVPDALSRKHQLRVVYVGKTELQKEIRLTSRQDAFAKEVRQNIQNGAKSHFHLRNGLLWYKQNRLYVPEGKIRDTILRECHDGPLAGHGGAKCTITFLKKSYYWPNLKDSAEEYVKTYLTCQQNRTFNKKQAGLLRPLPIPEGPWESVSMDFMVSLPPSRGFDAIMVVVDRFNKMAHFIPTKDEAMAQEIGRLFFTHVFKHHGLPKDRVSDRDPKFTSKFWRALWKRMGSELKMSTSFRPQTDGQIERVNLVIQQFLRNYVAADQQDWVDHLELAEFYYNNSEHSVVGSICFQMVTGKSPIVPMTWVAQG